MAKSKDRTAADAIAEIQQMSAALDHAIAVAQDEFPGAVQGFQVVTISLPPEAGRKFVPASLVEELQRKASDLDQAITVALNENTGRAPELQARQTEILEEIAVMQPYVKE